MEFKLEYDKFKLHNIGCDLSKYRITHKILGSGGSDDIIVVFKDGEDVYVAKILIYGVYENLKIQSDEKELEMKISKFLTNKYLLTDRTPGLVGCLELRECDRLAKLLNGITPSTKKCPSYDDRLIKKPTLTDVEGKICDILLRVEFGMLLPTYSLMFMENCPVSFNMLIEGMFYGFKMVMDDNEAMKHSNHSAGILKEHIFQIIFTLAIIKNDYPGFLHGDLFMRNILFRFSKHERNEYVAYHYKQKIFYFSATGFYAKISDFGRSIIMNELESASWRLYEKSYKYHHNNPFNTKSDIFNLLHDLYDGEGLGASSVLDLANRDGIARPIIRPIINMLGEFLDIKTIDRINRNNRQLLNDTWNIDNIKILEKTVKSPHEYLMSNIFSKYQTLPEDGVVIKHYNQSK